MAYIVVEGPIGAGKTSLSRLLAEHLRARLLLEVVEENPFLAPFYEHPEQNAFKAQVFFLLSRYKQLQDARQGALFQAHTVADYLFDKDFIFASLNLAGAEWELYQDLYQQLHPRLSAPDLVVYLRAEPELLLRRIALRGRPFETRMEAAYLRRIGDAYDAYFSAYGGSLRIIEAAQYDFVASEADRERLVGDILGQAEAA